MTAPAPDQTDRAPHLLQTIALTALAQEIDSLLGQGEPTAPADRADAAAAPSALSGSSFPASTSFFA